MANLTETNRWEAGIYQLETSDPVMGGPNGIDNRPTRELANRTLWLKTELAKAVASIGANKTSADTAIGLKADKSVTITAGAGLSGGGSLAANRSLALTTPSTLNGSTTNWAGNGATGHTHELAKATATVAGVVKLVNALDVSATDAALSAAMGKKLGAEKLNAADLKLTRLPVAAGSTAVDLNLASRASIIAALGDKYISNGHIQAVYHNTEANHNIRGLPLTQRSPVQLDFYFMGGYTFIDCHYVLLRRTFRARVNFNNEALVLDWKENLTEENGLKNSGVPELGGRLNIKNAGWEKLRFINADNSYWRFETAPVTGSENGARFNYVFVGASGSEVGRISFPRVSGGETVAYQNWVSSQIDAASIKTLDYTTGGSVDYTKTGFFRANNLQMDGKLLPLMEVHVTHPGYDGNRYARGLGFAYGPNFNVFTTAWDKDGIYQGYKTILTELNGMMTTGAQTVAGVKTFTNAAEFSSGIKIGGGGKSVMSELGVGASDIYLRNTTSNKYLQLKDDGTLAYSNQKIYHEGNKPGWADIQNKPNVALRGTTLAHYGIVDSVTNSDFQWAKAPPGTVAYFAGDTAPHGWLVANGAAVSRTGFPDLFRAIGIRYGAGNGSTTFNLPDLRGEFVRGWDAGRGVDLNRVLGSLQADEFRSHSHIYRRNHIANTVGWEHFEARRDSSATLYDGDGRFDDGGDRVTTAAAGGVETRPRNVALLPIIKA